ncbi:hypothetical protein GDO86_005378 [Hymenochirus boettgeri]|uniref:Protein transport protein Sec24A n=1 Tax=Hymenochirus boettgeri TaxID=247094 RepID=A0A8T2J6Z4_9PIPI|nr:hypothetical protein GDO86_005378 [Hymenochirus boettgeri]
MSGTGYNSQNGGSGPPYINGPVQNPLIFPSPLTSQSFNSVIPGSFPRQISAKVPPPPGQYNYGGLSAVQQISSPQNFPQSANSPVSEQTVSRPPMGHIPGTQQHTVPGPGMPPTSQNYSNVPSSIAAPVSQGNAPPQSNWQYFPTPLSHAQPQSFGNHMSSSARTISGQPSQTNSNVLPAHQYVASYGGHHFQNNLMTQGPSINQPLRPPLGPPPTIPTSIPSAPSSGPVGSTTQPPSLQTNHGDITATPSTDNSVQNSYDTLEGGRYMGMVHSVQPPPPPQNPNMTRNVSSTYPALPPGYQNVLPASGPGLIPTQQQYLNKAQQMAQPSLGLNDLTSSVGGLSLNHAKQLDELKAVNLLQERNILPLTPLKAPTPCLQEDIQKLNCNPELFRCTLTNIPQTQALLNKAKLPLGLLLHPFKDLSQLPVVTSSTIVRCRSCRTYINPFVTFLDQRRWKCNLCYRVNDVPEEFMYNPVTRVYGEPHKRPEVQNATIEFMAPSEYMLRPPQPPVYLFMFDVSHNAIETGYLNTVCQTLLDNLDW